MTLIGNDLHCLVFRTSLQNREDVAKASHILNNLPGIKNWFVDLDDWEKVLRIECENKAAKSIIHALKQNDVVIKELPV